MQLVNDTVQVFRDHALNQYAIESVDQAPRKFRVDKTFVFVCLVFSREGERGWRRGAEAERILSRLDAQPGSQCKA